MKNRNFLICLLPFLILPNIVLAANHYVRPNGGNYGREDGSDWNNAFDGFGVVQWGNGPGEVGAGDILWVAGGTYTSSLVPKASGSGPDNKIIVRRATTAKHGTNNGWANALDKQVTLSKNANILIRGYKYITVDGSSPSGFLISSTPAKGRYGVDIRNCSYVTIQYFTTDGSVNGNDFRGITIRESDRISVRYARFQNCPNDAIQLYTVNNVLIERCKLGPRISSSTKKHSDAIEGWITSNVIYRFNIMDWAGDGIHLGISTGRGTPSGRWDIYGNIFTGTTAYKTNSTNANIGPVYFYNNVFYNVNLAFRALSNTKGEIKNNIFYNVKYLGLSLPHDYNYFQTGNSASEAHAVIGDDPFQNRLNLDLRIKGTSKARNTGTNLGAPFDIDPNGIKRGYDGYWDIGAFEFTTGKADSTPSSTPFDLKVISKTISHVQLTWSPSIDNESGISRYNIYRDGNEIAQSQDPSYSDTGLRPNSTYVYSVSAVNGAGLESPKSESILVTTLPDDVAPSLVSVVASVTSVRVLFSEALDESLAEELSSYSINHGISIFQAVLDSDVKTVMLTTSAHEEAILYTLTVLDVRDISLNAMEKTNIDYEFINGIVGLWEFEEGSGNLAEDASGNGNTGLIRGAEWTPGQIGTALSIDGSDDYIEVGTRNWDPNKGTLILWAYANEFTEEHQYFFGHTKQPGFSNRIQLYTNDPTGKLDLGLGDSHEIRKDIQDLDTQRWYHIALTWDQGEYVVYVDGVARANGSYTGLSTLETFADIGNTGNSAERNEAFNGLIDDVRIYNRALNAEKIRAIITNPVTSRPGDLSHKVPLNYELMQNYPNPLNPSTTISFTLSKTGLVRLSIYNLLGHEIASLVDGVLVAGRHSMRWIPVGLSSGIYYYRIEAGNFRQTKTMLLIK